MKNYAKKVCYLILAVVMFFTASLTYWQAPAARAAEGAFGGRFDETGLPATYEVLTGHKDTWWEQCQISEMYKISGGTDTYTFYVRAITDAELVVELQDTERGYYVTACTNYDIWTAGSWGNNNIGRVSASKEKDVSAKFKQGEEYVIEVTRSDRGTRADYSIVITNRDTGEEYATFSAEDTALTGNNVYVYLLSQIGQFEMYYEGPIVLNHGTDRLKRVPLSDVNNTPPKDYKIPEGLVQDAKDKKYEKYFTKDKIQTVSVEMEEDNLNYMLQNATEKPSVMTKSVKIGDTTLGYAGIKTKGNWTLGATNDTSSDRFSFTLNFGKYIKKKDYGEKQNFYGCSKISFNNCYFDKTFLKEYHAMRLMDEMGLPTPQYSLAKLYINGAYYGVYFMVEAMDGAIIERYQNASSKKVSSFLVKPSYTSLEYRFDRELEQCLTKSGGQEFTMKALNEAGLLVMRDGKYYAGGALLSYQSMWEADDDTLQDVAEMLPKALTWNRRVQLLSNGKDFDSKTIDVNSKKYLELLESVMDTDEAVRYFAAHSFLTQFDNMFTCRQNYGVYVDEQGKSLFVPWDYDLAWGSANWNGSNTAEEVANWDIDKMYLSSYFGDVGYYGNLSKSAIYKTAPLFYVIYQNKSLMEKYHIYMEDCAKLVSVGGTTSDGKTVESARFAKTIDVFYPQVTEAAKTGQMRENVYYLNGINQPGDAVAGIPVLKKLMARRSVGVWLQTQGKKANVTGYGCEIMNLGTNFDGSRKNPTTTGELTVVDENTGIFATVKYPSGNTSATIQAEQLSKDTDVYKKAADGLENPVVYKIELANQAKLTEEYKLYIPVRQSANVYSYSQKSGQLQPLKSEMAGGVCCVTGSDLTYIVMDTRAVENKPDNVQTPGVTSDVRTGQTVTAGKYKYKIVKVNAGGKGEVILTGTTRKKSDKKFTSLNIAGELKVKGNTFKISGIGSKAFAGYPYLKKVMIGKNVSSIKAQAFSGCKKLKNITIKTSALTAKSVGAKAFKGISAKAVIKVPAKKWKEYKKLLRARGAGKKVKIKK